MINKERHHDEMLAILKEIYAVKEIAPLLGFKGGTAAYLFYNLPRFSVDLDFDLLKDGKEVDDLVFSKVLEIAERHGQILDKAIKHFTLYFALNYEKGQRRIKIEISRRSALNEYELKSYLGIPMNVMKEPDVAANKLLALEGRKKFANRDLFDVHYFLQKKFSINEDLIKEKSGKSLVKFFSECVKRVEAVNNSQIMHGIGELVETEQKPWIKNHLKKDTIFLLKLKIDILQREQKGNKLS